MSYSIRAERAGDEEDIHRVNALAFGTEAEANLVDSLRRNSGLLLSLVADSDSGILGHIAFSAVTVRRPDGTVVSGVGLAPMAVLPSHQRMGVGRKLVTEGLQQLREQGHRFCVVLGHHHYYPRFGFVPAHEHGLRWEHPAPEEAFMVNALSPGGLTEVTGTVHYRPEFNELAD